MTVAQHVVTPTAAAAQTLTATLPSALTDGSLHVLMHWSRGALPLTPAGFDLVSRNTLGTTHLSCFAHRVVGGDSASVTVDVGSGNAVLQVLAAYELDGVVGATVAETVDGWCSTQSTTSLDLSGIDTGRGPLTNSQANVSLAAVSTLGDPGVFSTTWDGDFVHLGSAMAGTGTSAAALTTASRVRAPGSDRVEPRTGTTWPSSDRALSMLVTFRKEAATPDPIVYCWAGAVTATAFAVAAELTGPASVRLAWSTSPDLASPTYSGAVSTDARDIVKVAATGLTARTTYYWALEVDGTLILPKVGKTKTAPTAGAATTYTVAFSSCSTTGTTHPVFDAIRDLDPDCFLHLGDLHYEDPAVADEGVFLDGIRAAVSSPKQAGFYRNMPVAYVWDDHDAPGGNDADGTGPGVAEGRAAYRRAAPHYPQPTSTGAIHQSFDYGRVRYVLLDNRSARDPIETPDGPDKTCLGVEQKAWLKTQIDEVAASSSIVALVICTGVPWIASNTLNGSDNWLYYADERAEIANYIVAAGLRDRTRMIAGDAHCLAGDSGANNTYADDGLPLWPVYQGSPLQRTGSVKGGPYDLGTFSNLPDYGQFMLLTVTDTGTQVDFSVDAVRVSPALTDETVFTHSRGFTTAASASAGRFRFGGVEYDATLYVGGVARAFTVQ